MTPPSLDVNFGYIPKNNVNGRVQQKNVTVSCNADVNFKVKIEGVGSSVSDGSVNLRTNRDELSVLVDSDRLVDEQGYFRGYKAKKDIPMTVPVDFKLKVVGDVFPGGVVGNAWLIIVND
ncbi:hypothetical protein ACUJ63_004784 [Salmonella enterica subsp. enterica]